MEVAGCVKDCKNANNAAQELASLVEKGEDELTESVSSMEDRVEELQVAKSSSNAGVVALGSE